MITVHLDGLLFNAFHGIHEEEKVLGNEYMVDCSVEFYETTEVIGHINETVNYAVIYDIIKERMNIPTPLLETVVMEIGNRVYKEYSDLKSITVSIKKLYPPIEGMQGASGVTWHKEF
ncbi:MAG TPA: dihydroneopterin aldolase [Hanamia sp.]|nr:dihydroneopterin aldolase [Hanamia sp.]